MGKKSKKDTKAGGDFWEDEDVTAAPEEDVNGGEAESNPSEASTPAPESASADEAEGDFLNSIRQSKSKKAAKEEEEKNKSKDAPKILSKKEKEKLKKEAEKQKKKELANKKKAQQASKKEQIKEANKQNAAAASSASATPDPEPVEDDSKPKTAPKKGGKKVPAGLAALRRQLELKKQMEEEQRLADEEQEKQREEAERLAAEEEKRLEEAKAAKKEKERLKKEQLKAEGKLLTKKQKEEKKLQERRRQQLLQANNLSVAGLSQSSEKPKKVVYSKKKTTKPKQDFQKAQAKADSKKREGSKDDNEEALVDDWEKMALDSDEEPTTLESSTGDLGSAEKEEIKEEEEEEENEEAEDNDASEEVKRLEDEKRKALIEKELKEKQERERIQEEAAKDEIIKKTAKSGQNRELRSPICCILGHVDTGKTKLLDKVRQTNVQGGEAGGITQQIGATYFEVDSIKQKTQVMAKYEKQSFEVPGLLIIDTPGHESFTNLRSRGSSLCNIAILVIDLMHGLEQQTLESIRLLRDRKVPFVVALNKIDRLYDWKTVPYNSFRDSFGKQSKAVQSEFQSRYEQIKLALAEQGLNSELYYQNKNMAKYVSIVPTSAVTGEGVPDLLWLLLELTQKRMSKQLMYLSKVEATILEVKVIEGFGYTIDIVLSNGVIKEGDRIVLCGLNGPIATNIRALLTPPPSRELRIKSEYVHSKEVKAALGVKIAANDLEKAVAGSRLVVVNEDDDEEQIKEDVMEDLTGLLDSVDTSGRGVSVQASTLGSLEALLDFLKDMKIPVMSIGLGPVYKRDVMRATTMLEKAPEYAVMLCFDVKVDKEAQQYADEQKIQIFNADIIYHLFDEFTKYQKTLLEKRRRDFMEYAVFPCVLKTIQIINKRNPMIVGVDVTEGTLRIGTPIAAVRPDPTTKQPNIMVLGKVVSLEVNHKSVDSVKKGQTAAGVAMRLENPSAVQPTWGRHVDESDNLYSLVTRKSIDTLKDPAFRDSVHRDDWVLLKKLKPVFDIK